MVINFYYSLQKIFVGNTKLVMLITVDDLYYTINCFKIFLSLFPYLNSKIQIHFNFNYASSLCLIKNINQKIYNNVIQNHHAYFIKII